MKKFIGILSIGANIAAIVGLLIAIYTFIFPASMSEILGKAQEALDGAANNAKEIAVSTAATSVNTQRLADAIPNWVKFEHGPYRAGNPLSGSHTIASLVNVSPYPIEIKVKSYDNNKTAGNDSLFIMPGEIFGHVTNGWPDKISYCIEGKSPGLGEETFYEYRLYSEDKVIESEMGFDKSVKC